MARVVLLTGGNTGDVKRTLQAAQQLINARVGAVLRCSHRYESKPWGFDAEQHFSNQALEVSTDLQPLEVLEAALSPRMSTRSNHIPTMKPCCFRLETARFFSFLQIRHTK